MTDLTDKELEIVINDAKLKWKNVQSENIKLIDKIAKIVNLPKKQIRKIMEEGN